MLAIAKVFVSKEFQELHKKNFQKMIVILDKDNN